MFPYARREIVVVSLLALVACDPTVIDLTGEPSLFEVRHDAASGNLWVTVYPGLAEGHTLHMRVTNQRVGGLDCALMSGQIPRIDGQPISLQNGHTFRGPAVNAGDFQNPYDITWLESEPTRAQIGAANAQTRTIQLCQMNGSEVVRSAEMDIARALDIDGTGKFDGPYDEEIKSVVAYARACEYELGANPFFPRLATGDYATYSCLDSTPIPTVVTSEDGTARLPRERSDTCDDPQFIYSLCEPNAVSGQTNGPRVASRQNIRGTHWVILCRKSKDQEGEYNDIAMIGHNPYTGKTCFFQNALYSRTDGLHIPDPADEVDSPASPQQSASLWSGIQGGIGRGIECGRCHDSDAFIHTPWIDGAKDERGDPIIPQLGIDDGFVLGFNEAPYQQDCRVGIQAVSEGSDRDLGGLARSPVVRL